MATIRYKARTLDVKDGNLIAQACEELGVPFACHIGVCGICAINILEGEDNLSDLTENEISLGMDKKTRLACQCNIKKGTIEIDFQTF